MFRKSKTKKLILPIIFGILIGSFLIANVALALETGLEYGTASGLGTQDLRITIMKIIRVVLGFVGVVAIAIILYGGFIWMTSAGSAEKIEKAKKILINAVIGLVIIFSAFMIVSFIIGALMRATGLTPSEPCTADNPGEINGCYVCTLLPPANYQWVWDGSISGCDSFQPSYECRVVNITPQSPPDRPLNSVARVRFNYSGVTNLDDIVITDVSSGLPVDVTRNLNGSLVELRPSAFCDSPWDTYNCFGPNTTYEVTVNAGSIQCGGYNLVCGGFPDPCSVTFTAGDFIDTESPTVEIIETQICQSPVNELKALVNDDYGLAYVNFTDSGLLNKSDDFITVPPPEFATVNWGTSGYGIDDLVKVSALAQDYDDHNTADSQDFIIRAGHCCNNVKDVDEESIDCGGADCEPCVPTIEWVWPLDGAPGNMITIHGRHFTSAAGPGAGEIYFADSSGEPTILAALADDPSQGNPACSAVWSDTEIIAVIPPDAENGPIQVSRVDSLFDRTDQPPGSSISDFVINSIDRPGLCGIFPLTCQGGPNDGARCNDNSECNGFPCSGPPAGTTNDTERLEGTNFNPTAANNAVYFASALAGGSLIVDGAANTITGVTVPAINNGTIGVRVKDQASEEYSNPLTFIIGLLGERQPYDCTTDETHLTCPAPDNADCNPDEYCNSECKCVPRIVCDADEVAPTCDDPQQSKCPPGWFCYDPATHAIDPDKIACYCYQALYCDNPANPPSADNPACHPDSDNCPDDYFCDPQSNCTCQPTLGIPTESTYTWFFNTTSFGPRVVEICNRLGTCDENSYTSPSPFSRQGSNAMGLPIGLARPDDGEVAIDAVVTAMFTTKMYLPSLEQAGNISVYQCSGVLPDLNCGTLITGTLFAANNGSYAGEEIGRFSFMPSSLLNPNTWYLVDLSANQIFGENGVNLIGNDAASGDYKWLFKTKNSTDLSTVGCVYVKPPQASLYYYSQTRDDYEAWPASEDNYCVDIRPESCDLGWNWQSSDITKAEVIGNPAPADNTGSAMALAETINDVPPYIEVIAECRLSTLPSVFGNGDLYIDFSSPRVINQFPDCGTACLNAKIGATFSKEMNDISITNAMNFYVCYDDSDCPADPVNIVSAFHKPVSPDPAEEPNTYTGYVDCFDVNGDGKNDYCLLPNTYYRVVVKNTATSQDENKPLVGLNFDENGDSIKDSYSWVFKTQKDFGLCLPAQIDVIPTEKQAPVNVEIPYASRPKTAPDRCDPDFGQRLNPYSWDWAWQSTEPAVADLLTPLRDSCGNKVVEQGEDCDDGNLVSGDGCSDICLEEGDPDTGNTNNFDVCGNGLIERSEECEFPGQAGCGSNCLLSGSVFGQSLCGDGQIGLGEECDDGELLSGDVPTAGGGCSAKCLIEDRSRGFCRSNTTNIFNFKSGECLGSCPAGQSCIALNTVVGNNNTGSVCGNGLIESGEECDLGGRCSDNGAYCTTKYLFNCANQWTATCVPQDVNGCSSECLNTGSIQEAIDPPDVGPYQLALTLTDGETYIQSWLADYAPAGGGPLGQGHLIVGIGNVPEGYPVIIDRWPDCGTACINAAIGAQFNMAMDETTIKDDIANDVIDDNIFLYECGNSADCDISSRNPIGVKVTSDFINPDNSPDSFNITLPPFYNLIDHDQNPATAKVNTLLPNTYYRVVVRNSVLSSAFDHDQNPATPNQKVPLAGLNYDDPKNGLGVFDSHSWVFKTKATSDLCTIGRVQVIPEEIVLPPGVLQRYFSQPWTRPDECDPLRGQRLNAYFYDWRWDDVEVDGPNVAQFLLPLRDGCGNLALEFGEDCDDGNTVSGDGCSSSCQHEGSNASYGSICGNSRLETGEDCDDGNTSLSPGNGDYCDANCLWVGNTNDFDVCGNGVVEDGEECDTGDEPDHDDSDGCTDICTLSGSIPGTGSICGDGQITLGEECDDADLAHSGTPTSGDGCTGVYFDNSGEATQEDCEQISIGNPDCHLAWCRWTGNACGTRGCLLEERDQEFCRSNKTNKFNFNLGVCDAADPASCPAGYHCSSLNEITGNNNWGMPICGDGRVQIGEECDWGSAGLGNLLDGCSDSCLNLMSVAFDGRTDPYQLVETLPVGSILTQIKEEIRAWHSLQPDVVGVGELYVVAGAEVPFAVVGHQPPIGVDNQCRNVAMWAIFSKELDLSTLNNDSLQLCQGSCGTNLVSSYSYQAVQGTCNASNKCDYASAEVMGYGICQTNEDCRGSKVTVTGVNTPSGFLDENATYQILVNDSLTDINGNTLADAATCGGATACSWNFTTSDDFCECDYVGVAIDNTSAGNETIKDFFTCAGNNCGIENTPDNTLDDDVDSAPGNQHLYKAQCYDINNPTGSRIPIGLNVNYTWSQIDPDNLIYLTPKPLIPVDDGSNSYVTPGQDYDEKGNPITPVPKGKNGLSYVSVVGTASLGPNSDIISSGRQLIKVTNFICDNPWPDMPPYNDNATNFDMYFCQDFGISGTSDDLPSIVADPVGISNSSAKVVKEFILPVCENQAQCERSSDSVSSDALAVRVMKNPLHLSPQTWYRSGLCGGRENSFDNLCFSDADCSDNNLLAGRDFSDGNDDLYLSPGDYSFVVSTDKDVEISASGLCQNANYNIDTETGLGSIRSRFPGQQETLTCNFRLTNSTDVNFSVSQTVGAENIRLYGRCQLNVPSQGSPQPILVDGYQAIRDGRTVYVGAANQASPNLYSNIYLISYNQSASSQTQAIFNRILDQNQQQGAWLFNSNVTNYRICNDVGYYQGTDQACFDIGNSNYSACSKINNSTSCNAETASSCYWSSEVNGCLARICEPIYCDNDFECPDLDCNASKEEIVRDTKRYGDLRDIQIVLNSYAGRTGSYPALGGGSYIGQTSFSVWPSWQRTLGQQLGSALFTDPINQFKGCPGYYCDKNSNGIQDPGEVICNAPVDLASCPVGNCLAVDTDQATTCWDEVNLEFSCPADMFVYGYHSTSNGSSFGLYTNMEYEGAGSWRNGSYELPPLCQKLDLEVNQAAAGGAVPVNCTVKACQGGVNDGSSCTTNGDCPGGYCSGDIDVDGVCDDDDNCAPAICDNPANCYNPAQRDSNGNGLGDVCDPTCSGDADFDGICDYSSPPKNPDNCRTVYNPLQTDSDGDDIGDACDPCTDLDSDGWWDVDTGANDENVCPEDNCKISAPLAPDRFGYCSGDKLTACNYATGKTQNGKTCGELSLGACALYDTYNPYQEDYDNDGVGYICDQCIDFDNDNFGDYPFYTKSIDNRILTSGQQWHFNSCSLDNCPAGPNGAVCHDNFGIEISCFNQAIASWNDIYGGSHTQSQLDSDIDGLGNICDDREGYCDDKVVNLSAGEICDCGSSLPFSNDPNNPFACRSFNDQSCSGAYGQACQICTNECQRVASIITGCGDCILQSPPEECDYGSPPTDSVCTSQCRWSCPDSGYESSSDVTLNNAAEYTFGSTTGPVTLRTPTCRLSESLSTDIEVSGTIPPVAVVFVSDLSGSMKDNIFGLQSALTTSTNALFDDPIVRIPGVRIGLVNYSNSAVLDSSSCTPDSLCGIGSRIVLNNAIDTYDKIFDSGSCTRIDLGIDKARTILKPLPSTVTKIIVLMSDGDCQYKGSGLFKSCTDVSCTTQTTDQATAAKTTDGIEIYSAAFTGTGGVDEASMNLWSSNNGDVNGCGHDYCWSDDNIEDLYNVIVEHIRVNLNLSFEVIVDGTVSTPFSLRYPLGGGWSAPSNVSINLPNPFCSNGSHSFAVSNLTSGASVKFKNLNFNYCPVVDPTGDCSPVALGSSSGSLLSDSSSPPASSDGSKSLPPSGPLDAAIEVFRTSGMAPYTVLFNAQASTGDIVRYEWNFGDSNPTYPRTDEGRLVGHRFDNAGSYNVNLTVYDAYGSSNSESITINVSSPPAAPTYYVSSAGNDSFSGTSPSQPLRTIDEVISRYSAISSQPGSKILFRRGDTFPVTGGIWNVGGLMLTPPNYITIGAYGSGSAKPIISGQINTGSVSENRGLVIEDIQTSGDIIIRPRYYSTTLPTGFREPGHHVTIRNVNTRSVSVDGSKGISLENVYINHRDGGVPADNVGFGSSGSPNGIVNFVYLNNVEIEGALSHCIYLAYASKNVLVENSNLHDCGIYGTVRDGFTVHGYVENIILRNSLIHDNGYMIGLDSAYTRDAVHPDPEYIRNVIVEDNTFYGQISHGMQFASLQNAIIRNNIFYDNNGTIINVKTPAIGLPDEDSFNIQIYNNVLYSNDGVAFKFASAQVRDMYLKNNIILDNNGDILQDDDAADLVASNNIYFGGNLGSTPFKTNLRNYSLSEWLSSGKDPGSKNQNPLFVNAASKDFRLQLGSPAINAGTVVNAFYDKAGTLRSSTFDIGAYESSVVGSGPSSGVLAASSGIIAGAWTNAFCIAPGSAPPTCTTSGNCDGVCPSVCTIIDDPDCGCQNNNGCCAPGCNSSNDNDCAPPPTCPDTNCDTGLGENCTTCPADCPTPGGQVCCAGALNVGDCCTTSDCSGSDTCINNICTPASPTCIDGDTDGFGNPGDVSCPNGSQLDCNDSDPAVNPGAFDGCDGLDNDCNGSTDEDYPATPTSCGIGACQSSGQNICQGGSIVNTCTPGSPSAEICGNSIDDDCDGTPDDGCAGECSTGDITTCGSLGYLGICSANTASCDASGAWDISNCENGKLTSDTSCNNQDNDCDGLIDENYTPVANTCGIGACKSSGQLICQSGSIINTCAPGTPSPEICGNSVDEDCNSILDNGCVGECNPSIGETTSCGSLGYLGICSTQTATCNANGSWNESSCLGVKQPNEVGFCTDNIDNDCDGNIDCQETLNCPAGSVCSGNCETAVCNQITYDWNCNKDLSVNCGTCGSCLQSGGHWSCEKQSCLGECGQCVGSSPPYNCVANQNACSICEDCSGSFNCEPVVNQQDCSGINQCCAPTDCGGESCSCDAAGNCIGIADADFDGLADNFDPCPYDPSNNGNGDFDGDGVCAVGCMSGPSRFGNKANGYVCATPAVLSSLLYDSCQGGFSSSECDNSNSCLLLFGADDYLNIYINNEFLTGNLFLPAGYAVRGEIIGNGTGQYPGGITTKIYFNPGAWGLNPSNNRITFKAYTETWPNRQIRGAFVNRSETGLCLVLSSGISMQTAAGNSLIRECRTVDSLGTTDWQASVPGVAKQPLSSLITGFMNPLAVWGRVYNSANPFVWSQTTCRSDLFSYP